MKYLWIGVGTSDERRKYILENGVKLLSGDVANDAWLSGLSANNVFCDTINSGRLPTYPTFPEKRVKADEWKYENGAVGYSISYLNRPYINLLSKRRALVKQAKRWAIQNKDEDVTVFVYQMHTPFMAAAAEVKRVIPNAKIVQIVPDLPQYMDMNMSTLKKVLKKLDWQSIKKFMRKTDKYVLYSKHMANFLKLRDGDWMVMEGAYDSSLMADDSVLQNDKTISIMYSGVIDLRYGIKELLDALNLLDDNYELWFTGNGNAVDLIKSRAEVDKRIKYLGYLPTRLDLLNKQKEATMLISTRDPSEVASVYCFPSKIFEYMVSGNPVLSTRIDGIPEEYFEYIIPLDALDAEYLATQIRSVANMSSSERYDFGNKAKLFVLNEKNTTIQTKKVLDFLKG